MKGHPAYCEENLPDRRPLISQNELGEGSQVVYVYHDPTAPKIAKLEKKKVWRCKIGRTINSPGERILI